MPCARLTPTMARTSRGHPEVKWYVRSHLPHERGSAALPPGAAPFCVVRRSGFFTMARRLVKGRYPADMDPATVTWALSRGAESAAFFDVPGEDDDK